MGVKKRDAKQIKDSADRLPVVHERRRVFVTGAELLASDPHKKTKDGKPIDSQKSYHVTADVPVDHYRKMKDILKHSGRNAVNDYIRKVVEDYNRIQKDITVDADNAEQEIASGIAERTKAFSI